MILNRDTKPATLASSKSAKIRRKIVIEQVREKVFEEFCTCGKCKQGNYAKLCMSNTELAGTLNALKVASPRGKIGTWQATMVKNLFRNLSYETCAGLRKPTKHYFVYNEEKMNAFLTENFLNHDWKDKTIS